MIVITSIKQDLPEFIAGLTAELTGRTSRAGDLGIDRLNTLDSLIIMPEVYLCYSKWNQEEAAITGLLEESGIKRWLRVYIEETSLSLGMSMRLRRLQVIHEYKYEEKEDFYAKLLSASGLEKCK